MAKKATIYHNPRCSKSRQTLQLLRDNGIEPEIVEYLNDSPSASDIEKLIGMLGGDPGSIVRTKEQAYKESGLSKGSSASVVAKAIAKAPIIMERPVVVVGNKAAMGRPPENVLELL